MSGTPAFRAALRDALKGDGTKVEREHLEKAAQSTKQADTAWLKASGYDFKVKDTTGNIYTYTSSVSGSANSCAVNCSYTTYQ